MKKRNEFYGKALLRRVVWLMISFAVFFSCKRNASTAYTDESNLDQPYQGVSLKHESRDGGKIPDAEITDAILTEFMVQDGVSYNAIDVETTDGMVTLSGNQRNILAKERAVSIAQSIRGVRGVIDRLNVLPTDLSDDEIKDNVEMALLKDPATDSYEVKVEVDDGKVKLSGEVQSYQEKDLAGIVAKGVKGVREVQNNLMFTYAMDRPASEIKEDILQTLKWNIRVDDGLIQVKVNDKEVMLSGVVGSSAEKREAIHNAWVQGVESVNAENLKVQRWARDEDLRKDKYILKSDQQIKKAIEDAFLYDPRVNMFAIEIKVDRGTVTLRGHVDNLRAKNSATIDAKNVVGVWKVNNLVKVRTEESWNDDNIRSDVTAALERNPYIERYEIRVSVNNGKVNLSGAVDNYLEKFEAQRVVEQTNGVVDVENNLRVDSDALPFVYDYQYHYYYPYAGHYDDGYSIVRTDREIKDDIENQLWWSPHVDLEDVTVSVKNGIVVLTGDVDSWSEYYHAEQNAFEGGAVAVENNLAIHSFSEGES